MSRLSDLIRQAKAADSQLGADLEREFRALGKRRTFGLVFERHQPEAVELAGQPVRKGDKVRVLPSRGVTSRGDQRLWSVTGFAGKGSDRVAHLVEVGQDEPRDTTTALVADLVIVAEFRDDIYPGLIETGRVEHGGDKPFHTVINAENFHALEMLTYTHRHAIDAIYIDPPYNKGSFRDWKYNNLYVEADDDYRHSKWLAMMERRLLVAAELLNPADSVLIVTIDELEVHRLGLLLEQLFPEARVQMVSSIINPKGVSTNGGFRRADEYIFFVMFGSSHPARLTLAPEWSPSPRGAMAEAPDPEDAREVEPEWTSMMRRGSNSRRVDRPTMFYPIYADPDTKRIVEVGEAIPAGTSEAPPKEGLVAILPLRRNGSEGRWQVGADELRSRMAQGRVRLGRATAYGFVVNYLPDGAYADVQSGKYEVRGRADDGSLLAYRADLGDDRVAPTQWKIQSHNASEYGSTLISDILPGRRFDFPKSLYAVEDTIRFFVQDKPTAVVLDFFAGSGTTAHAVMRLNKQDGGQRQCISVTNNEVSADEQGALSAEGLRPGDPDWEKWGVCDHITKPRIKAAITGKTPDGDPLRGAYKFNDEFPMAEGFEENAAFFTLTYEGPLSVAHHRAFARIAPMLWLRAGARGPIITEIGDKGWDLTDVYGVLDDLDTAARFVTEVKKTPGLAMAYIVTDDDLAFQMVCRELPKGVRPVQLYESYLRNFEINSGRFA
ncbi:site-specific DNA-methyltransferase [Gordonia amarae]|uniref:site-specific DNA-methyltransferase n=1 Tax=Gordonia amarae TaxID=36821 RepID=UPI001AF56DBF|nr:DNA methyltransferase [Gordonia amarae]QHN16552.1 site-specific DNA-methyltransferase [Gordonia amarae]